MKVRVTMAGKPSKPAENKPTFSLDDILSTGLSADEIQDSESRYETLRESALLPDTDAFWLAGDSLVLQTDATQESEDAVRAAYTSKGNVDEKEALAQAHVQNLKTLAKMRLRACLVVRRALPISFQEALGEDKMRLVVAFYTSTYKSEGKKTKNQFARVDFWETADGQREGCRGELVPAQSDVQAACNLLQLSLLCLHLPKGVNPAANFNFS